MEELNNKHLSEDLDLYNACGKPLGRTKPRKLVHRDGDWHKTFHCWVIYTDESGLETLVFQRRGEQVELWPGKLDITAAGHYHAGEGIEGGVREIQEELGLAVNVEQLIYAGIRVNVDELQLGIKNHEFQDVYFLINNHHLTAYTPQAEELTGLLAVPIPLLLQLLAHEIEQATVSGVTLPKEDKVSQLQHCEVVISQTDFIPYLDHYYHRVAILAQRILRGERYIWI